MGGACIKEELLTRREKGAGAARGLVKELKDFREGPFLLNNLIRSFALEVLNNWSLLIRGIWSQH